MITFQSEKLSVRGPLVDGGYSVTFSVGEYEQLNIAKLLTIPQQTNITVEVKIEGELAPHDKMKE